MNLLGGTLAADASSQLHEISVGPDGNLWTTQQTAAGSAAWTPWSSAGQPAVPLTGPVAAATDQSGVLQIFATGQDGNVYNAESGSSGWTGLGAPSGVQLGGLGVAADPSGLLWLFGAGSDGNVYFSQETSGGTYSSWTSLGAPGAALGPGLSLGAALDGAGSPLVCAVGGDGNMYAAVYDSTQSAWGSWASLGAPNTAQLVGNAAAAYLLGQGGAGQVWAFGVATDGNLWQSTQTAPGGAWSAWTYVGSAGSGFIGVGPIGALYSDQLYASGIGGDGNLYLSSFQTGSSWQPWTPLGAPLTKHEPMFTYSVVELGIAGTIDMGSSIDISLDGNSPFSIGLWFRLADPQSRSILLQKGQELTVSLAGTETLSVELGSSTTAQATIAVQLGRWHYLLLTFSPSGQSDSTGALTIYLDGYALPSALLSGISSTDADFIAGGDLHAQLYNVSMWSAVLEGADLLPQWTPPHPGPTLAASFWFAQGAAVDTSGNGQTVTLGNDARIVRLAPGLSLDGASYVQPGPLDPANPGGGGDPFSLTAWVHPLVPHLLPGLDKQQMVVFANGTAASPAGLICSLEFRSRHDELVWTVRRGGALVPPVAATKKIRAGEWSHVAVTYDGSTLTLYVDGDAAGSAAAGPIAVLPAPAVTIGAMPDGAAENDFSGYFSGGIQGVSVWTEALSQAQVAVFATTDPTALTLPGLAAFYRFGVGRTALDTTTGIPLGLIQGAAVQEFPATPPATPPVARLPLPSVQYRPPSLSDLPDPSPPAREPRPISTPISARRFDELIASYAAFLHTVPEDQRAALADRFEQNLYRGARIQAAAGGPTPGMVTHAREGDDVVFYHHSAKGADEVGRASASVITPCTAWIIDIVAMSFGLLASVIGAGFSVAKVVQYLIKSFLSPIVSAVLRTAQATVQLQLSGTDLVIKLARTVYNGGLLASVIDEGLSGYSWWSWIFAAVGLILNIVALWVTGGWWLAFMLAQLAVNIAQLIAIVDNPPPDCITGPRITGLSAERAPAGSAAFTLTVGGDGFQSGAAVSWNGSTRTTSFESQTRLSAQIDAGDLATPGTARVSVTNPGTDPSNELSFSIA